MPRFDLHFQGLSKEAALESDSKIFEFGFNPVEAVNGFQMLVNMWAKCFFTRKGSDPADVEYGTAFANLIGSNTSPSDADDVVRMAIDDCNTQIFAIQQNDPSFTDDERLASARLLQYRVDPTGPGIEEYIELKNQAGSTFPINLPDYAKP